MNGIFLNASVKSAFAKRIITPVLMNVRAKIQLEIEVNYCEYVLYPIQVINLTAI